MKKMSEEIEARIEVYEQGIVATHAIYKGRNGVLYWSYMRSQRQTSGKKRYLAKYPITYETRFKTKYISAEGHTREHAKKMLRKKIIDHISKIIGD